MENVPTNPSKVAQPVKKEKEIEDRVENLASNKNEWTKITEEVTIEEAVEKLKKLNKKLKEGETPWRLPTEDEIIQLFHDNSDTRTDKSDIMRMGMDETFHNPVGSDSWYESDRFFATSNKDATKIITPYYSKQSEYSAGGDGDYRGKRLSVRGLDRNRFYSSRSSVIFTREKVKAEISKDEPE